MISTSGLRFANLVLNRHLDLDREDDSLAAMPLFLSLRAAVGALRQRRERWPSRRRKPGWAPKRTIPRSRYCCGRDLAACRDPAASAAPVSDPRSPNLGARRGARLSDGSTSAVRRRPETRRWRRLAAAASRRVTKHWPGRGRSSRVFGDHRCRIAEARGARVFPRGRRSGWRPVCRSLAGGSGHNDGSASARTQS